MAAWRYELSFLVLKNNSLVYFSTLEEKFRISIAAMWYYSSALVIKSDAYISLIPTDSAPPNPFIR